MQQPLDGDDPLDRPAFAIGSYVLLACVFAAAVYLTSIGARMDAIVLLILIAGALAFIAAHERLPTLFTLLFVLAGLINAAGYVLKLWKTPWWFDEFVHVYTPFAITAAAAWLMHNSFGWDARRHPVRFVLAVSALGLAIGIGWEIFEYLTGIAGSVTDTLVDLACDVTGAIAAGLLGVWSARATTRPATG